MEDVLQPVCFDFIEVNIIIIIIIIRLRKLWPDVQTKRNSMTWS
jgi:hypothetical protein